MKVIAQILVGFRRIIGGEFFKNFSTLSIGSVVAQIVPFLATLVLSRLYTPEEMGEWGLFSSYGSILSIMLCLRYDGAIVKSKTVSAAYNMTYLCLMIAAVATVILYCLIAMTSLFSIPTQLDTSIMLMLPLYVLILTIVTVLTNLATYLREFKLIAINSINRSIGQSLARIALGFVELTRQGMIIGSIIGAIVSLGTLGRHLKLKDSIILFKFEEIKILAKDNIAFPKYDLISNLFNSVSSHCPPIILAIYFQDSVVGLFAMANALLFIPMSLVGSSISQLYYKHASELYNRGISVSEFTRKLFLSLFFSGCLFVIFILLTGDRLFGFLLGDKWFEVGQYACLLCPWILMVFALSPISTIFFVKDKQRLNMKLNIMGTVIRVLTLLVIPMLYRNSNITIFAFSMASLLFYLSQGYHIIRLGEINLIRFDKIILIISTLLITLLYIWKVTSFFYPVL